MIRDHSFLFFFTAVNDEAALSFAKQKFCDQYREVIGHTLTDDNDKDARNLRQKFLDADGTPNADRTRKLIETTMTNFIESEQKVQQIMVLCFLAGGVDWQNDADDAVTG